MTSIPISEQLKAMKDIQLKHMNKLFSGEITANELRELFMLCMEIQIAQDKIMEAEREDWVSFISLHKLHEEYHAFQTVMRSQLH